MHPFGQDKRSGFSATKPFWSSLEMSVTSAATFPLAKGPLSIRYETILGKLRADQAPCGPEGSCVSLRSKELVGGQSWSGWSASDNGRGLTKGGLFG